MAQVKAWLLSRGQDPDEAAVGIPRADTPERAYDVAEGEHWFYLSG